MKIWKWLKDFFVGLINRNSNREKRVEPYRVDRQWIEVERHRVNEEMKDKWNDQ